MNTGIDSVTSSRVGVARPQLPQRRIVLAAALLTLGLTACGGGAGGSSSTAAGSGTTSTGGATTSSGGSSTGTTSTTTTTAASHHVQYVFGQNAGDGGYPYGPLLQAADGSLYGTTFSGGANNAGTVFRAAADGSGVATLYSFGASSSDGAQPIGGLVQAGDGNFYGTTSQGGAPELGTVFQVTPTGAVTQLHAFGAQDGDGTKPSGTLALGPDGNLYGTTQSGGAYGGGTVFRVTTAGVVTTLYSFGAAAGDGAGPYAGLVLAGDGNFYGTTPLGGANGEGSIFKVTPGGAVSTVYSFTAIASDQNADGALPYAGLVLGRDGRLYGTTSYGGSGNFGTLYALSTAGAFSVLHQFQGGADGAYPRAGLVVDSDGSLVGTTSGGGDNGAGLLYRLSNGALTALHAFGADANAGSTPYAALIKASDGGLYGTTLGSGAGTLFSWK